MPPQNRRPNPFSEDQSERNQYIPAFIAKKPFYIPNDDSADPDSADYLGHQRLQRAPGENAASDSAHKDALSSRYTRSVQPRLPAATKFRKGACENCGAMTHKAKDCLSRQRKLGARWTGVDIQPDQPALLEEHNSKHASRAPGAWDAKRDRWNGYDASDYASVLHEHEELERLRGDAVDEEEGDDDGTALRDQPKGAKTLRIREDTAKYLFNLKTQGVAEKYDPKTRRMVPATGKDAEGAEGPSLVLAEEMFIRKSGEAGEFDKAQRYAWETQQNTSAPFDSSPPRKLHLQANPTEGALAIKKRNEEMERKKKQHMQVLKDLYGTTGIDDLSISAVQSSAIHLVTESERYQEYDETGAIKGAATTASTALSNLPPKSRYAEDEFRHNHTSVWGSWWHQFRWGYSCCYSTVRNSYCTGAAGREAVLDDLQRSDDDEEEEDDETDQEEVTMEKRPFISDKTPSTLRKRRVEEDTNGGDGELTDAQVEEYKRQKIDANDPMAGKLGRR